MTKKRYRFYNDIGVHNILSYISPDQVISIRRMSIGEFVESLYDGTVFDLNSYENRFLRDKLEMERFHGIGIEDGILVIERKI